MSVRALAPAKINLTLQVGQPRADGLHPLTSVIVFADVADGIEVQSASTVSLRIEGPFASGLGAGPENLVLRAAAALAREGGVRAGASITLQKNLPIASGIGGGSSDAAATLKALNQLWALGLSESRLVVIARSLGSDVPVCVGGRSAYLTGAGEHFVDLDVPRLEAVLVNPLKPLPTPSVYRCFDAMGLGADFIPAPAPRWRTAVEAIEGAAARGNDLAPAARALLPDIETIESMLREEQDVLYASVSGSGATVFALVDTHSTAVTLAARFSARYPMWWVRATSLNVRA
ncbi:MAG: 4-(cytidine 5'-diphospho)-2-C-methyl-D-erythritol kinase [Hyphomonadaceae bacterium]|nr:4-(cytidine 5'-diphospho)-2-C-methyl-D-erythritol kinase [Hyphomonadaceae bacterium]